jgi:hypothetical protein
VLQSPPNEQFRPKGQSGQPVRTEVQIVKVADEMRQDVSDLSEGSKSAKKHNGRKWAESDVSTKCLFGVELRDCFAALRHSVLGEVAWQNEADGSLDFTGSEGVQIR